MSIWHVFTLQPFGILSPLIQVILIILLLGLAVVTQYGEYKRTGKTYGRYPFRVSIFLSSIYEEIIFRGIILFGLLLVTTPVVTIIVSSLLFGIWHFKNYKWQTFRESCAQAFYTGVLFGPLLTVLTLLAGTIWPAVIVHYANNLLGDAWRKKRL